MNMSRTEIPFTRLPTKLLFVLDSDLLKMLALLIQQESYWQEHKKLGDDGSFYKPMQEFADVFRKKNPHDVRLMLQTLQQVGFIDIMVSKGGKQANYYRINWDKIQSYNDVPICQLIEGPMLKSVKRGKTCSTDSYYQPVEDSTESYQQSRDISVRDCTTTIDNNINIDNSINKENRSLSESPLYVAYKQRIEDLLTDYQRESDYMCALSKYTDIENTITNAEAHLPTYDLSNYKHQLNEHIAQLEKDGWNLKIDGPDYIIENYGDIQNIRTPYDTAQFKQSFGILTNAMKEYVNPERRITIANEAEIWVTRLWEKGVISYDQQQDAIAKLYKIAA